MGKYQGYEKYKDSGVKWLGDIPEYWEVKRIKYAFLLQRGSDLSRDEMEEGKYPVCASNGIIGNHWLAIALLLIELRHIQIRERCKLNSKKRSYKAFQVSPFNPPSLANLLTV
jgi:hypothetical protein